jgi:hypothetical protein
MTHLLLLPIFSKIFLLTEKKMSALNEISLKFLRFLSVEYINSIGDVHKYDARFRQMKKSNEITSIGFLVLVASERAREIHTFVRVDTKIHLSVPLYNWFHTLAHQRVTGHCCSGSGSSPCHAKCHEFDTQ